jgi:Na+/proline symporter
MDGLLVAVSASVAGDLFPGKGSVRLNQAVLAVLGLLTILISLSPPSVVLILGQQGVYGLVAASVGPLVAGLFLRGRLPTLPAFAAAIIALVVHFGLALTVFKNPGVAASIAAAVAVPVALIGSRFMPAPSEGAAAGS